MLNTKKTIIQNIIWGYGLFLLVVKHNPCYIVNFTGAMVQTTLFFVTVRLKSVDEQHFQKIQIYCLNKKFAMKIPITVVYFDLTMLR